MIYNIKILREGLNLNFLLSDWNDVLICIGIIGIYYKKIS